MRRLAWMPLVVAVLALAGAGSGSDVHSPEFRAYQAELRRLRSDPPADELVLVNTDGWQWRKLALWIKARAAAEPDRWVLTVYLEDTAGNRVRTAPNRVRVTTSGRLMGAAERDLKDGEASVEVSDAGPLEVSVKPLPEPSGASGSVMLRRGARPALRAFAESRQTYVGQPPTREKLDRLRADAREYREAGRPWHARWGAYLSGKLLLLAGQPREAEAAFAEGWREFGAPRCGWAQARLLRRRGETQAAAALEREVRERYPQSVVAQFLAEPPEGEVWFCEDADLFTRNVAPRP